MKQLSVQIDEDISKKLKLKAIDKDTTISVLIRNAINKIIEE